MTGRKNGFTRSEIYFNGLRTHTTIGIYDHERAKPMKVSIDLRMQLDAEITSDSIEESVNYATVVDEITAICKRSSFYLVETLAQTIIAHLVDKYSPPWVSVRLNKVNILTQVDEVGVLIEHRRGDDEDAR